MTLAKNMRGWAAAMLLAGAVSSPADYVILNNDSRLDCKIDRRKMDGTLVILVADGSGKREIAKSDFKMAVRDPAPEAFATGIQQLQAKNWQAAIDTMEKVASETMGLEVDKQARYVIAKAYIGMGKASEAISQFDQIAKVYGDTVRKEPAVAVQFAAALLAAHQNEKLGGVLDDIIRDGPRSAAAKAQTLRGQMREQQGQLDAAIQDYMRTAVYFEKDGGEAVPEALYRAAKVLDMKRDPRAKTLYKRIADDYKESPYAKEAAGRS